MFNIQFLFLAVGIVCLLLILSAIRSYLKFQKAKIELITFKTICEEKNSQIKNLQEKTSLLEKDKEELVKINGKLSATIENQNKFMEEKIAFFEKSKEDMALKFKDISNEIIKAQNEHFGKEQTN